jgi:hypothetical protein
MAWGLNLPTMQFSKPNRWYYYLFSLLALVLLLLALIRIFPIETPSLEREVYDFSSSVAKNIDLLVQFCVILGAAMFNNYLFRYKMPWTVIVTACSTMVALIASRQLTFQWISGKSAWVMWSVSESNLWSALWLHNLYLLVFILALNEIFYQFLNKTAKNVF